MKKTYINPTMEVVKLQMHQQMLAGSTLQSSDPADVNGDGNYNTLGREYDFDDFEDEY